MTHKRADDEAGISIYRGHEKRPGDNMQILSIPNTLRFVRGDQSMREQLFSIKLYLAEDGERPYPVRIVIG